MCEKEKYILQELEIQIWGLEPGKADHGRKIQIECRG